MSAMNERVDLARRIARDLAWHGPSEVYLPTADWIIADRARIAAQVRAQIAADIEALATAAESKRDEHREIAISYLAKSDQRIRHMATALAFRNQADGLRTAEMVARGDT